MPQVAFGLWHLHFRTWTIGWISPGKRETQPVISYVDVAFLAQGVRVTLPDRPDALAQESVDLFGRSPHEPHRVHDRLDIHARERRIGAKPVQEVVRAPFPLDSHARSLGVSPDPLVQVLPV